MKVKLGILELVASTGLPLADPEYGQVDILVLEWGFLMSYMNSQV